MSTLIAGHIKSISASREDMGLARVSSNTLLGFVDRSDSPLQVQMQSESGEHVEVTVPIEAVRVMSEVLRRMARGETVTVIPLEADLSTQQGAELLGVSRPYFVRLLESGKIPFRKVGEQRRVKYQHLVEYIEEYQRAAKADLDQMTSEAQLLGLYD